MQRNNAAVVMKEEDGTDEEVTEGDQKEGEGGNEVEEKEDPWVGFPNAVGVALVLSGGVPTVVGKHERPAGGGGGKASKGGEKERKGGLAACVEEPNAVSWNTEGPNP